MSVGNPKLSIITVCWNVGSDIELTIKSVLDQTYKDYEHVIIDGGSTDTTLEYIRPYIDKLGYFVSEKDSGIYNAMNKGIQNAKGEYLMFLNAGDIIAGKNVLSNIFKDNPTADILYSDFYFWDREKGDEKRYTLEGVEMNILYLRDHFLPHTSSFIKKDLFVKHGMYDESYKIAADHAFFIREISRHKVTTQYIPDVIVSKHNIEGISTNEEYTHLQIEERWKAMRENMVWWQFLIYVDRGRGITSKVNKTLKGLYYFALRPLAAYLRLYSLLFTRKKIQNRGLLIAEYDSFGGTRTYFKQLLEFYHQEKKEIMVCIHMAQLDEEIEEMINKYKFSFYLMPEKRSIYKFLLSFPAIHNTLYDFTAIAPAIRKFHPEFITVSVGTPGFFIRTILFPLRWIYILHTYPSESSKLKANEIHIINKLLGTKKIIVTVSEFSKSNIMSNWVDKRKKDFVKVVNNYSALKTDTTKKKHDKLTVLTVGHVEYFKNPSYWIEIAHMVNNDIPNQVDFVWIGDGNMREECIENVKEESFIKFVGYKNQEEIAKLYSVTDVYFQPSKIESFGISVADAMKCRIPCVVSNAGGLPELIENGVSGFVVPLRNKKEMANAIVKLLKDKKLSSKISDAAFDRYKNNFSLDSWIDRMSKLHENILRQ